VVDDAACPNCVLRGQAYADQIIKFLDPGRCLIKRFFYRDSCSYVWKTSDDEMVEVKDLSIVGQPLSSVVLIDNRSKVKCFLVD
jgi:TFIIF-interacting CTD phosphatase-like protein